MFLPPAIVKFRDKQRARRRKHEEENAIYGGIEGNFFHYMTWKMWACILLPVAGIIFEWKMVVHFFTGGEILLNAFICTVFFVGMIMATAQNIAVWRTARFLRMLSHLDGKPASPETVALLIDKLHAEGELVDISNMENCLKNLERFGHLNFTDFDARLIKSKLGQRINEGRKKTGFLGGLLVLMGLIGTYIGLLHTIDKVAGVMKLMANLTDASAMSGFVGALSEPLQGMGVAFSASLFGIGGSTALSIYTAFSKGAQHEFIEAVSRWIDARIPKFAAAAQGSNAKALGKAASAEDLRTWLAGFVNLSVKTNNRLNQLAALLMKNGAGGGRAGSEERMIEALESFKDSQRNVLGFMQQMSGAVTAITDQQQKTLEYIHRSEQTAAQSAALLHKDLESLRNSAVEMTASMPMIVHMLSENRKAQEAIAAPRDNGVDTLKIELREQTEAIRTLGQTLGGLRALPGALQRLDSTQSQIADGIARLQVSGGGGAAKSGEGDDDELERMLKSLDAAAPEGGDGLIEKLLEPEEDARNLEQAEADLVMPQDIFKKP